MPLALHFIKLLCYYFHEWYKPFSFQNLIEVPGDGKRFFWEYRIIFLNPPSRENIAALDASKMKKPAVDNNLEWGQTIISAFYSVSVPLDEADIYEKMGYAVQNDQSIAIVAMRMTKNKTAPQSWVNNANVTVVSAVTFRQGNGEDGCKALVTFLAVSNLESIQVQSQVGDVSDLDHS